MPHSKGQMRKFAWADKSLESVALPPKLKCSKCEKSKGQAQFSTAQLNKAREAAKKGGSSMNTGLRCIPCNGKQIVEIKCVMCRDTKGLEEFSKTQRKDADTARCYKCVEDVKTQAAIDHDAYESEDQSRAFLPAQTSTGHMPNVWDDRSATNSEIGDSWTNQESHEKDADGSSDGGLRLSDAFEHQFSIGTGSQGSLLQGFDNDHDDQDYNSNGWKLAPTKSWHTKSNNTASERSGFNPNSYGNPASRHGSASLSGSVQSFNSGLAERTNTPSNRSGFAKIRAYNPRDDPNASGQQPQPIEDFCSSSEEEDDDDEEEDNETII